MSDRKYKVIRTDFERLEGLLNRIRANYLDYHLYQVLSEHSADGAFAIVILESNQGGD